MAIVFIEGIYFTRCQWVITSKPCARKPVQFFIIQKKKPVNKSLWWSWIAVGDKLGKLPEDKNSCGQTREDRWNSTNTLVPSCKAKSQLLFTFQVISYCLLALQNSIVQCIHDSHKVWHVIDVWSSERCGHITFWPVLISILPDIDQRMT